MSKKLICLTMLVLAGCATAPVSQVEIETDPDVIQVMVLGAYHMAGSSGDLVEVDVENVLAPQRQAELERLVETLAEFKPTAVVTERVTDAPDYVDPKFADFDDAALASNPNERAQIGYRLAREAGVSRVYGIDEQSAEGEPDYFPFGKLQAHAEATGQAPAFDAYLNRFRRVVEEFAIETADQSIPQKLLTVNTGALSSPDFYYGLAPFDVGEDQPAAELQAYWFMRNAKIWSKLLDVAKPGDRIFIVYGAGHKFWLEHLARHTEGVTLVDPAPYLRDAAESLEE